MEFKIGLINPDIEETSWDQPHPLPPYAFNTEADAIPLNRGCMETEWATASSRSALTRRFTAVDDKVLPYP